MANNKYKNVIIDSLNYFVKSGRLQISVLVIMSNHTHLVWQAKGNNSLSQIHTNIKKFTSQQILKLLMQDNRLGNYQINAANRKYHFWKCNLHSKELFTETVLRYRLVRRPGLGAVVLAGANKGRKIFNSPCRCYVLC